MAAKTKTKSRTPPSDEVLEEFKRLFRAARRALAAAGPKASADIPAYCTAVEFAENHHIPGVAILLKALLLWKQQEFSVALKKIDAAQPQLPSNLFGQGCHVRGLILADLKRYDEAIACYQKALDTPGYDTPGQAHYNTGLVYAATKDYDRAIASFQKVHDTPGFDGPGNAHYNIGIAYANKKDYDRAIASFQKALDTPGFDTPGDAHYNMGVAFTEKKDFDRAIISYEKAIDTPGFDTPSKAHNNMGSAYNDKKNFDRAIACYQKAVETPGWDTPGMAHHNMGLAYAAKKDFDRAIACYQKALDTPGYATPLISRNNLANTLRLARRFQEAQQQVQQVLRAKDPDQHERAKFIAGLIAEDLAGLAPDPEAEALAKGPAQPKEGEPTPVARILAKLQDSTTEGKDKYETYLFQHSPVPARDDLFSCLRAWSSAVTLLEGGKDCHWSGGGYFLKWRGRGIVIDPGFDFLDNFHDAGYNGREIDAVLVSHNHPDHNYDLGSVDDLRYELHRRWRLRPLDKRQGLDLAKCLFVVDEDTQKSFKEDKADHRGIPLKFDLAGCSHGLWYKEVNGLPLTIEWFKVEHGKGVPHAVGMRLRLHGAGGQPDFVVGYTGDTAYLPDLPAQLSGCDLLLAHISMPDNQEYNDPDHYKEKHLGFNGLSRLLEEMNPKPKITLVGEFWAGLADLRIDLVQSLRQRTAQAAIFPTGLGFHVHLPSLEIECTGCHSRIPHSDIKIAPATTPYGPLGYLCQGCLA